MNEKKTNETKATHKETTRRDFLKGGAAAAAAALLGQGLHLSTASAAEKKQADVNEVESLFVQNADDLSLKDGRLILFGISPTTIFFSDRPQRIAGHMSTEDFVREWQKGAGPESFKADPPNGALSVFSQDQVVDMVLTLKNPRLAGGALVYDIDILEPDQPLPSGPVSLFIDPIGRPLTPVSVSGGRRRTRRRTRRRAAVLY